MVMKMENASKIQLQAKQFQMSLWVDGFNENLPPSHWCFESECRLTKFVCKSENWHNSLQASSILNKLSGLGRFLRLFNIFIRSVNHSLVKSTLHFPIFPFPPYFLTKFNYKTFWFLKIDWFIIKCNYRVLFIPNTNSFAASIHHFQTL